MTTDPKAHIVEMIRQLAAANGLRVQVVTPDEALTAAGIPAANITDAMRGWAADNENFRTQGSVSLREIMKTYPGCWIDERWRGIRWGLSWNGGWHALADGAQFRLNSLGNEAAAACGARIFQVDSEEAGPFSPERANDPSTPICSRCVAKAGPPDSIAAARGGAR